MCQHYPKHITYVYTCIALNMLHLCTYAHTHISIYTLVYIYPYVLIIWSVIYVYAHICSQ